MRLGEERENVETIPDAVRERLKTLEDPEKMADFVSFMKSDIQRTISVNGGSAYAGLLIAAVVSARTQSQPEVDDRLTREEFLEIAALIYDFYDRCGSAQDAADLLVSYLVDNIDRITR